MKYITRVYSFLQIVRRNIRPKFCKSNSSLVIGLIFLHTSPVSDIFFVLIVVPPVSEISTGKSWSELLLSFKDMCVLFSKSRKGWHSSIISEQVLGMALKGHEREASMRAATAGHSKPKIREKKFNIVKQLQCFHQMVVQREQKFILRAAAQHFQMLVLKNGRTQFY